MTKENMYTVEFYSAIKKNEIVSVTGKWIELETTAGSKSHQTQKDQVHIFLHMKKPRFKLIHIHAFVCAMKPERGP